MDGLWREAGEGYAAKLKFKILLVLGRNTSPPVRIKLLSQIRGEPLSWAVRSATLRLRIMRIISAAPGRRPFGSYPSIRVFSPYRTGATRQARRMRTRTKSEEQR